MKNMKPELLDEMDSEKRVPAVKFRCRHFREPMIQDGAITPRDNHAPDERRQRQPSEPSCFVCGKDVCDSGSFAQVSIPSRTLSLCSAPCALMFFEAEEAPAHDPRARHDFEQARDTIIKAAKNAMQEVNS